VSYEPEEIAALGGHPPGPAEPRDSTERRIERALKVIARHPDTDGAHHKQWVINQVVVALTAGTLHLEDEGTPP
jgi:hypothetical protein